MHDRGHPAKIRGAGHRWIMLVLVEMYESNALALYAPRELRNLPQERKGPLTVEEHADGMLIYGNPGFAKRRKKRSVAAD